MRKFKRRQPRSLPFRLLVILAGALLLLAAFAPRANAALIRYYNMEGVEPTPPYEVNLDSHLPAVELGGPGRTLFMDNGTGGNRYPPLRNVPAPGLTANLVPGDPAANLNSFGTIRSGAGDLGVEIPMLSTTGFYDVTSVSFGYANNGNGFDQVQLQMSTDGGTTFNINLSGIIALPNTGSNGLPVNIVVPSGTTANKPNLVLRLLFSGGQSNGVDLQFQLDNVQINGTIIPEPATVAGGLLGVLGLCWHQRRRLIRCVRLRRT